MNAMNFLDKIKFSTAKYAKMKNGARTSARFTVHHRKTLEITVQLSFCTLKRRERRAPYAKMIWNSVRIFRVVRGQKIRVHPWLKK
jgi:hypothetical protein